jgi:hypothetical protein
LIDSKPRNASNRVGTRTVLQHNPRLGHTLRPVIRPRTSSTTKIARKMKNNTRAMSALAADMPVKPKSAATSETTRKINAHFNYVMATRLGW